MHEVSFAEFELSDDADRIAFARVHDWLRHSYWSPGISAERLKRALEHSSLVVGVYHPEAGQCGVARVVSDFTRFAYVMDVIVDDAWRGQGLGKALVRYLMEHPQMADIDTWTLATEDAHGLYRQFGFQPEPNPGRWMVRRPKVRECDNG